MFFQVQCVYAQHTPLCNNGNTLLVFEVVVLYNLCIYTDYGRILLKILVGEMAAQPIFRKGAVWWWWCKQGRSTTTVFVGWSVLAQSTQPSNHHLESTTIESHPYMWHVWNTYWSHHRERAMGMGEKKLAPHGSSLVFLFSDDLVPRLYRRLFEIVRMEKVRETTRNENWNHVKKDLKYSWHLNQDNRVILWNFCDLTLLRFDWHALTW